MTRRVDSNRQSGHHRYSGLGEPASETARHMESSSGRAASPNNGQARSVRIQRAACCKQLERWIDAAELVEPIGPFHRPRRDDAALDRLDFHAESTRTRPSERSKRASAKWSSLTSALPCRSAIVRAI